MFGGKDTRSHDLLLLPSLQQAVSDSLEKTASGWEKGNNYRAGRYVQSLGIQDHDPIPAAKVIERFSGSIRELAIRT